MMISDYLSMWRMRTMSSCSAPNASNFSIATRPSVGQSGQLSTCKISNTNVFWIAKVQDTLFLNCTLKKIPCPGKNWSPQRGPRFHHPILGEFSFRGMKLYKEEPPTWQSCHRLNEVVLHLVNDDDDDGIDHGDHEDDDHDMMIMMMRIP